MQLSPLPYPISAEGHPRARARGASVLVGDVGRAFLPRERFVAVATYEIPVARALEDADIKSSMVWRL